MIANISNQPMTLRGLKTTYKCTYKIDKKPYATIKEVQNPTSVSKVF